MRTLSRNAAPPCTTRWPTASMLRPPTAESACPAAARKSGASIVPAAIGSLPASRSNSANFSVLEPAFRTRMVTSAAFPASGALPGPVRNLGRVDAVFQDEALVVLDLLSVLADELLGARGGSRVRAPHFPGGLDHDMKPADAITHEHVERRRRRSFLTVAVDVEAVIAGALPAELLDRRRVAVEVVDDRDAERKDALEAVFVEAVGILARDAKRHEISGVHDADSPLRSLLPEYLRGRADFESQVVPAAREHDVRIVAALRRGPLPDGCAHLAMRDGFVHREPLMHGLLPSYDKIDIVDRAQAVIHRRQKAVGVGRQIDPVRVALLGQEAVDEPRPLMGVAVVVLPPRFGSQKVVERGNRLAPAGFERRLQELGILIQHPVHDRNECLVAGEEPVTPGQKVPFKPTLAHVLGQDLEHAAIPRH